MYHKEEVVSSACASEWDLNRRSCSTCFFVQGFLLHSNVNEKLLPIDTCTDKEKKKKYDFNARV